MIPRLIFLVATVGLAVLKEMAPSCQGYSSKAECDDGDMVLFGGS